MANGNVRKRLQEKYGYSANVGAAGSVRERLREKYTVNENYLNKFLKDTSDYFSSAETAYSENELDSAADILKGRQKTASDLKERSSIIRKYLDNNKTNIENDAYASITTYLDSVDESLGSFAIDAAPAIKHKLSSLVPRSAALSLNKNNIGAGAAQWQKQKAEEIDGILAMDSSALGEKASADPQGVAYEYNGQKVTWNQLYKGKQASEEHEAKYTAVTSSKDFEEKSGLFATSNEAEADYNTLFSLQRTTMPYEWEHAKKDGKTREEWEAVTAKREEMSRKYGIDFTEVLYDGTDVTLSHVLEYATHMNDEERQILSYVYNSEGLDAAKEYIDTIKGSLDYRAAVKIAEQAKGKTVMPLVISGLSGVSQFASGLESLFTGEEASPSRLQYAAPLVGEDFAEKGAVAKFAYDAVGAAGNMLPSMLVSSAVGLINPAAGAVTGAALMGGSAGGNAYSQMLELGYSKDQARNYGVLVGASEALLQYAFGGISKLGGVVTKGAVKNALSGIDNALAKFAIRFAGSFAGEALEEGAQSALEPVFKALATGENIEAVNWEQVAYDALLGGVLGGVLEGPNAVRETVSEAVAGKETFGEHQGDLVKEGLSHEDGSLAKKLAGKYEGKMSAGKDLTGTELYTLANANAEAAINESAAKIEKELTGLGVKGDVKKVAQALAKDAAGAELSASERRLLSSEAGEKYTNEVQRARAFEADLSKYAPEQRATVQKAIDSGILNNTKTTHFFVDFVAKISADKGVSFDFINNEKLKASGLALEGVTVNGYVSGNGVTINVNSAKALNSVVGHEITHVLEGTKFYDELQTALFSFAESKGEYQSRYEALEGLYKGLDETALRKELAADLVGDYIFTDEKFVRSLSTEHKNVFQRIYDEIKYLVRSATAGSAEARELEKIKKIFDKVYSESSTAEKNTADGGVRYSISPTLETQLDAVLNGTFDASKNEVYLGETSNFMTSVIGAESLSLYMPASKAYSAMVTEEEYQKNPYYTEQDNYHGIGKKDLIEILEKSEAPIAAFAAPPDVDGNKRNNRIVLVTDKIIKDLQTGKDGYAVVVEEVNSLARKGGKRVKANKTITVYPRTQLALDVKEAFASGRILDINKKGEQFLAGGRGSNPQAAIQETVLKNNIANFWANVKWENQKNKKTSSSVPQGLTPIQAAFAKAGYTDQSGHKQYTQKEQKNSLSPEGISIAPPIDGYNVRGEDVVIAPKVEENAEIDIAPPVEAEPEISIAPKVESESEGDVWKEISDSIRADTLKADTAETVETVEEAKAEPDIKNAEEAPRKTVKEKLESKLQNSKNELERVTKLRESTRASYDEKISAAQSEYASIKNKDSKAANTLAKRIERLQRLRDDIDTDYSKRINDIEKRIGNLGRELKKDLNRADRLERRYESIDKRLQAEKAELSAEFEKKRAEAAEAEADKDAFVSKKAKALYDELSELKKGVRASRELGFLLDHGYAWSELKSALINVKESPGKTVNADSVVESVVRESINESYEELLYESEGLDSEYEARVKELDERAKKDRQAVREEEGRETRTALHARLVEGIKNKFSAAGLELDEVLRKAKDLSTWSTVDNIPQRVMEKALGYKAGGILADETVNKVAQNETEGVKWLNSITDRKSGLLSKLSKKYGIKPGSKESAAAQMYAEGFFVDENGDSIEYGDAELAKDFPSEDVQKRIKGLATDPRIRAFYDETLDSINESRARNGYPEIPKLENYFLHFRAMEDTFSRLGLPFNPNDIRAKDLPTDLNGMTADLKPGQPYFASSMHREGKRTSHDLLGGMERYANAAKNQIYHIDDIQTLRALRNYIADMYGQANGLEGLDALSEEEAQDKIKQVYGSHLSTFAKFLNEEANVLAGKTHPVDRSIEHVFGRRGITFLSTLNGQVGRNMVGFNISSSLTNFLPVVQTFAKTGKYDFLKGFTQTVGHKLGINKDGFTETSPVVIRRRGSDRFYRTPYQKIGDVGYVFMSAVDDISTEIIARAKYNELTRKGMDSQKAHFETDKWVSRLMGDRSLGQMPQLYNSKMLGLVTKFQLEVRNQLDSQFYDTIQEAKVSNEHIKNGLARNAKTAAKVTSTFLQLAIAQHLFGAAFEAIAGYNPAFDIISVMLTAFGWGDEEDDEDTVSDNLTEALHELADDLPYASILTGGGRIPISSALPIEEFIKGVDEYGNEKPRLETLGESLPYYLLPGGFGQIKKTAKGLSMFDDDLPISGSYTDSGGLRFPVEKTPLNVAQAAIFGQWASENASKYFDGGHAPLKEKQIEEFVALDIPIEDYWEIREGLAAQETTEDKFNYIAGLDLPTEKKNILINNAISRKNEVDIEDYEDYSGLEEFDFANNYPEKYEFLKKIGVSYDVYDASEESRAAYNWAYSYPEKYEVSKAVTDDIVTYRTYTSAINKIEADKDANGKSISGSRKAKVVSYINDLDLDYGARIILYKSVYESDDTYNRDIVEYLIEREDVSSAQMRAILTELGFTISSDGSISW